MIRIAVAAAPAGEKNFGAAFRALGAYSAPVLYGADLDAFDALVLPGGADIAPDLFGEENTGCGKIERERDLRQLDLMDWFVHRKKPVFGVCKGHQLLNVYYGGRVIQDIPEAEIHRWTGADQSHESHCRPDCFLMELYGTDHFRINSAHHQAVGIPAPGFRAVQWAEDGILEAMLRDDAPVLGIQWHPERACLAFRRPDAVDGLPLFAYFLDVIRGKKEFY